MNVIRDCIHVFNKKAISDKDFIYEVDVVIIILSIFMLRLPIALGYRDNFIYRGLGIIPIFVTLLFNISFIKRNRIRIIVDKKVLLIYSLFSIIWIQAILRTAFDEINLNTIFFVQNLLTFAILGGFVFSSFWASTDPVQQLRIKKGLVYAFGLYITVNITFYLLGIDAQDLIYLADYPAQMLSMVAGKHYRVLFPMADGINSFGLLAGAVLVGHFEILKSQLGKVEKIIVALLIGECFFVIFLTDSRGALISSILMVLILHLPRRVFIITRWSPFVISLIPLLIILFAPSLLSAVPSWLTRPKSEWVSSHNINAGPICQQFDNQFDGVLSNRPFIWSSVIRELSNFKPIYLVGYGFRGQVISNISESYSCLFSSFKYNLLAPAHNIWLQLILDIGYFGFVVTISLIYYLIVNLTKLRYFDGRCAYVTLIGILLYVLLIGSIESSLSPDFYGVFILLIYICVSNLKHLPDQTTEQEIFQ
jgi:hypothetical protein